MESRNRSKLNIGGRTAALAAVAGLALGAGDAFACSLANWSSNTGGVIANQPDGAAGDPGGDTTPISRYEALCGMQAPAGAAGFVQDNRPNSIDRIRARFYVLNDGVTAQAVLYEGYGNETGGSPQLRVELDPSSNLVELIDNASATSVSQSGDGGWESIEIDWNSGEGNMALSVNGQAAATASGLSAGSLESVRLGNINGVAVRGSNGLIFDAYEAHRTTEVGRLCNCNANGSADGAVNVNDVVLIVNEASGTGQLSSGTPDCNEDGQILVQDVTQTVNLAAGAAECIE